MARFDNFFSKGFLNRASWLRQDSDFLTSALTSGNAKFVILDAAANPLVKGSGKASPKDVIADKLEGELVLANLGWKDVSSYYDTSAAYFVTEPSAHIAKNPLTVFLGIDERSSSQTSDDSHKQQSLPKQSDEGLQPKGNPYFVIDTTNHPELAKKAVELQGGEDAALFMELRAEILSLDFESTGVVAEARALVDWNKRNRFCPGCGNETSTVWGGWKRACLPDQPPRTPERPACVSKKGVHNFAYPRTDPVVIMGVQSADKSRLLLGRQKAWPKGFFSCLAGFIEPGESIEESVKREVWEEAGVRVDDVTYHSSQPWPFPGSLMLGLLATAESNTEIRLDLDNELEHAEFYDYETVRAALAASDKTGISRHDVEQIQKASDEAEVRKDGSDGKTAKKVDLRIPPKTAIATTLIRAWVESKEREDKQGGARM